MQYRTLGRTGIKVSPYALGAMMFGGIGNADHDDSIRIIHKALDAGINFVDTADRYSAGESEEIVGKALKGRRDHVVLATKLLRPDGRGPQPAGPVPALDHHARSRTRCAACRPTTSTSTRSTGPTPTTDIEETLSALSDLVHSGKVRAIGSSTMPASEIVEAQWVAERRGLVRFRTEQPPYSILNRGIESEVLPVAQRYGMGTLVWSPLAKGMLTGRLRKNQDTDLRRAGIFTSFSDEQRLDAVEQIVPLAEEAGLPMTHLAMAFAIAHPGVTSAIIGPRTMEQLDDLLAGVEVRLDDDLLDRIDEIVPPGRDVGAPDQAAYVPQTLQHAHLRRRPDAERSAA